MSAISPSRKRSWLRSTSVSSMRKIKRPPLFRAHKWLKKAVRAFPRCSEPVGLGANRVTAGEESTDKVISQDCTYSSRISEHETATTHCRTDPFNLPDVELRRRDSGQTRGGPDP